MMSHIQKVFKLLWQILLYGFACIGFVLTTGFVAVKFGWSNTKGTVDSETATYTDTSRKISNLAKAATPPSTSSEPKQNPIEHSELCKVAIIGTSSGKTAHTIAVTYQEKRNLPLLINMVQAAKFRMPQSAQQRMESCDKTTESIGLEELIQTQDNTGPSLFSWQNSKEWATIEKAILKDTKPLSSTTTLAEVNPRLVVSVCLVEQLRLYFTQRELFEKIFAPLSILSSATKNAWGVMAIKEDTAIATEQHLQDPTSPYYLGAEKKNLLHFTTDNIAEERYNRLTNSRDHSYSYLYGSLFIAQLESQWEKAGFPISNRPEIIGTLFNLGFKKSIPKSDPQVGGSALSIADTDYTFGSLAYEIYYSGVLQESFPFED